MCVHASQMISQFCVSYRKQTNFMQHHVKEQFSDNDNKKIPRLCT